MLPDFEFETGFRTRSGAKDAERWGVGKRRACGTGMVLTCERVDFHSNKLRHRTSPFAGVIVQLCDWRASLTFRYRIDG